MQLRIKAPIEPVTPDKFERYLLSKGWANTRRWFVNEKEYLPVAQYQKESDEDREPWEINLPVSIKFVDYESNVYSAIQYLAAVENRSEYEIYQDIVAQT